MASLLQFRRGLAADRPTLASGEPGWDTDDETLWIGTESGNVLVTESFSSLGISEAQLPVDVNGWTVSDKIPQDDTYYQAVATDGTYLYIAGHNDGVSPNLRMTKINRVTGETTLSTTVTSSGLFPTFNDWNISDWFYHSDGFIYAVFGKTAAPRATKVVKIDPSDFSLDTTVYTSNATDVNENYYGEGIVFYDSKWWITYEGYSSGDVDYMDSFNSSWVKQTRYTFQGINTTNFPSLGVNHVQGIDFYGGFFWYTIHPQGAGFSYRGDLVAARIVDTNVVIVKTYDLSTNLDDVIGEGMQWYRGKLYLNGIDENLGVIQPVKDSDVDISAGNIVGTSLNDDVRELQGIQPSVFFPTFGSHYLEVSDNAALDVGTDDFTLLITVEPNGTQANQAGLISKTNLTGTKSYSLSLTSANKPFLILDDGTDNYTCRCEKVLESGKKYTIGIVVDYDLAEPVWYINGEYFRNDLVTGTYSAIGTLDNDGPFWIGRLGAVYYTGSVYTCMLFKRALSRAEIRKYGFGDVGNAIGQYATASRLASTDFSDANWTRTAAVTASGSLTFTTNAAGGCYPFDNNTLIIGKRYRLVATYTHTASAIEVRQGATSSTVLTSSATGATVDFIATFGDGPYFRLSGAGVFTATVLTVKELVDVVAFLPGGLTHKQWIDSSYNDFVAEFRGSEVLELPQNYRQTGSFTYRKEFITLDTTLTNCLPPTAYITSIIIYNRTANAVTGGIKIGTTAGGTEVVTAQAVGANAFVECATINLRLFSVSAYTTLYVYDVTDWNSANVDVFIQYVVLK